MSSLCLCLTAPTFEGAVDQLESNRRYIDMAELRLDLLNPEERIKALDLPAIAGLPLILTIRLPQDGGNWGKNGETDLERIALFQRMLEEGGWEWVDLEYDNPMPKIEAAAHSSGVKIIRSIHDFQGALLNRPVSELSRIIHSIADTGAIAKVAAMCNGSRQLLNLTRTAQAAEDIEDKILLGMGEYGAPSRILADRFGSLWTYASEVDETGRLKSAAPGQLDPKTLSTLYRFQEINAQTALYGVTGNPIAHSQSPVLHNHWLQAAKLNGTYLPILSDDLSALLETCDIWGLKGLSVTVPHKEQALMLAEDVDVAARKIAAANTLLRVEHGWMALNTDAPGFLKPLPEAMNLASMDELKGKKALIIGAGGAAKAAVHALSDAGMELIILNRTGEKARKLAAETSQKWGPLSPQALPLLENGVDLAVQTTTVGMSPKKDEDPIPWWNPAGCSLVYDMIYEPEETVFLARARKERVKTMNGSGMLEAQARLQFELFTGMKVVD